MRSLQIHSGKLLKMALLASCLMTGRAFALCGDVSGDGEILNNDVVQAARASIGTLTLDASAIKRGDVANPGSAADGEILNNDVVLIARKSIGLIAENLACNEAITPGSTISIPIAFTGGAATGYKAFQVTVSVTGTAGATLDTTQTTPTNALSFHTCRMSATTGKVLCVDTTEKVASGSSTTLASINVKVPTSAAVGSNITLAFADGLAVSTAGTTSSVTNLATSTTSFTVSAAQ